MRSNCLSWTVILAALMVNACKGKPTISTTLTDLIAESNDYDVDPLVTFHENVSINGLLTQPQVGAHWYTAKPSLFARLKQNTRSSPAFALGISSRLEEPSFCLYGEIPEVDIAKVNNVKRAIESIQAHTLTAINATVDLALARAASENASGFDIETLTARKTDLKTKIDKLAADKKAADAKLATELEEYRKTLADNPGIIVARWTARRSSNASVTTGLFGIGGSKSQSISGYVILGGIRISSLYFGDDLRSYMRIIEPRDQALFDQLNITTYLIQTKALAYTNALDLQQTLSLTLSARASSFGNLKDLITDLDKVTLNGYIATAMNLDNSGSMSNAQWRKRDRPMVEYYALSAADEKLLEERKVEAPRVGARWVRVKPAKTFSTDSPATDGEDENLHDSEWLTVVAVSANAPVIYAAFREAIKDVSTLPQVKLLGERNYMLIDEDSGRHIAKAPGQ